MTENTIRDEFLLSLLKKGATRGTYISPLNSGITISPFGVFLEYIPQLYKSDTNLPTISDDGLITFRWTSHKDIAFKYRDIFSFLKKENLGQNEPNELVPIFGELYICEFSLTQEGVDQALLYKRLLRKQKIKKFITRGKLQIRKLVHVVNSWIIPLSSIATIIMLYIMIAQQ